MIQNLMTGGASIEDTLALWASSLREAKRRIRPLFTQDREAHPVVGSGSPPPRRKARTAPYPNRIHLRMVRLPTRPSSRSPSIASQITNATVVLGLDDQSLTDGACSMQRWPTQSSLTVRLSSPPKACVSAARPRPYSTSWKIPTSDRSSKRTAKLLLTPREGGLADLPNLVEGLGTCV